MAPLAEHVNASDSPYTSEGIESLRGTPATKLSPFSPDEVVGDFKACPESISRSRVPPLFNLFRPNRNFHAHSNIDASFFGTADPFISSPWLHNSTKDLNISKLSPVASSFTPGASITWHSNGSGFSLFNSNTLDTPGSSLSHGSNVASEHDSETTRLVLDSLPTSRQQDFPLSPAIVGATTENATVGSFGRFSMDDCSFRALKVANVDPNTPEGELRAIFDVVSFTSLKNFVLSELNTGIVYLNFGDIRDTDKAALKVSHVRPQWHTQCVEPHQFSALFNVGNPIVSRFEGQIRIAAIFSGPEERFNVANISRDLRKLLQGYGDLMAMSIDDRNPRVVFYRAEFFDTSRVKAAVRAMQNTELGFCTLQISPHEPDLDLEDVQKAQFLGTDSPLIVGKKLSLSKALGSMSITMQPQMLTPVTPIEQIFPSHSAVTSDSGHFGSRYNPSIHRTPSSVGNFLYAAPRESTSSRSTPTHASVYSGYSPVHMLHPCDIGDERGTTPRRHSHQKQQYGQAKILVRRFARDQGPHNVVNVFRIQNGADVRTTIMLRNIPNKIGYAMLKDIVDETSRGKYDFMYLRIDFANNCNVGYAFVNFEDPLDIIEFVHTRAGRRWNCFNSDKVAEVSYATIQGKDCLVQKFRNSSVMLEHPDFRPKIFHTGDGPMAGTEQQFPVSDNAMKMRRSIANAEHIGLFAPRVGQNFRDEQRRRNSQYDRGTRHAVIEDSYNRNHHNYPNTPSSLLDSTQYEGMDPFYPPLLGHRY